MRCISASAVNTGRAVATWALRLISLALIATGGYLLLARIFWSLTRNLLPDSIAFYTRPAEVGAPFTGSAMLVVGAALGAMSHAIARWAIALPPTSCPGCGYAGDSLRCPECGLALREDDKPF